MEVQENNTKKVKIGIGIIFGLFAFLDLSDLIENLSYAVENSGYGISYALVSLVMLAANVLIVVGAMKAEYQKMLIIGASIYGGYGIYNFFSGFFDYSYMFCDWSGWDSVDKFNLFCVVPSLLEALAHVAFAAVVIILLTNKFVEYKQQAKALWFAPAAIVAAAHILGIIVAIALEMFAYGFWYNTYYWLSAYSIFYDLLLAGGFLCCSLFVTHPEGLKKKEKVVFEGDETDNTVSYQTLPSEVEGYYGIAKHVVLLIFTFGIWNYIWIYKVTNFLNRVKGEPVRSGTSQLLLCMFVPFYIIYWVYTSSQRIDKLAKQKGVDSDITVICLLFSIFVYILAPIFMQDKINNIVTAGRNGEATVKAEPVVIETPQPREETVQPETIVTPVVEEADDTKKIAEQLKVYKELLDSGIITQEEFEMKKREILGL